MEIAIDIEKYFLYCVQGLTKF